MNAISYQATIHCEGKTFGLDTVPAEVRAAIERAVDIRGRASGRVRFVGKLYRWGRLSTLSGAPIFDRRAYGDHEPECLPMWMRTLTGM